MTKFEAILVLIICLPFFLMEAMASLSYFTKKYDSSSDDLRTFISNLMIIRLLRIDIKRPIWAKIGKPLIELMLFFYDEPYRISTHVALGLGFWACTITFIVITFVKFYQGDTENILWLIGFTIIFGLMTLGSWRFGTKLNGKEKKRKIGG